MKKINFKKIGVIVLWFLGIAGLISSLAFVTASENKVKGKKVDIVIEKDDDNSFLDEDDILNFLKDRNDTFVNQPMKDINVYKIERALNTHPSIASSEVAVTVNGDVSINIKQRKPIVRIINSKGESFYIDNHATVMPLADHYTARVLIVNGFIPEKYSQFYNISVPQIEKDSAFKAITVIDDIYEVANYIKNDSLLNSLIIQAYINNDREIELYPAIGNQKIIFGNDDDIADKFEKLKIFYTQGLNSVDGWNKYSIINLKYKNQVVCIKKFSDEKKVKPVVAAPVVAEEKKKEETEKKEKITEDKAETKKPAASEEKKENKKATEKKDKETENKKKDVAAPKDAEKKDKKTAGSDVAAKKDKDKKSKDKKEKIKNK
jgi:cell division protein FtsQ